MFDLKKLNNNRTKAQKFIGNSAFHHFVCDDLIDRVGQINNDFKNILLISPILEDKLREQLKQKYIGCSIITINIFESENLVYDLEQKFDLILFPFGLHWINDVQLLLKQIYNLLNKTGIFIANFAGGGTLGNLRRELIELEAKYTGIHSPHISPFIQFQHVAPLLQHAGFKENIIDYENIELEYASPLKLMQALRNWGESNAMNNIASSITKPMYHDLAQENENFIDIINLITCVSTPNKQNIKLFDQRFI